LARLSGDAERLFWRLTIVADDRGRFDAYPPTVKAKCFPTLVDQMKTDKIRTWLVELATDHCLFYTVGERLYGQFRNWAEYQRQYGLKSKFPDPPASCGDSPQNTALILILNRESRIENRETISVNGGLPEVCASEFDQVWTIYPRKVGKEAARKAWGKLNGSRPDIQTLLTALANQLPVWKAGEPRFIPHLSTWLNGQRWKDEVIVSESLEARLQRWAEKGDV